MRLPLAVAAVLLVAAPAQGFASVDHGKSPHDRITGAAADGLGWPEEAVQALQAAVRQPDIDDLRKVHVEDGKDRVDASVTFRPWHHCDRVPPTTDQEAVNATLAYVAHERGLALNLSLLDPAAAMRAFGRALHAMQDCFSHSDVVDRPAAEQRALMDAFVHASPAPPLRVCGVQPGAPDIERPPGDGNPHADCNKDNVDSSPEAQALLADGRSKFEHALALATEATRAFLADAMGRLDATESERLLSIEFHEGRNGVTGIPGPGLAGPIAALAVAALAWRRPRHPTAL